MPVTVFRLTVGRVGPILRLTAGSAAAAAVVRVTAVRSGPAVMRVHSGTPGAPGVAGAAHTHTQSSPAASWTVNHNLGARPAVEVRTAGGVVVLAGVTHTGPNQCVIGFAAAAVGSVYCTL